MPRGRPARRTQVGPSAMDAFARVSKGSSVLPAEGVKNKFSVGDSTSRKRKAEETAEADCRWQRRTASYLPSSDDEAADIIEAAHSKRACRRTESALSTSTTTPTSTPTSTSKPPVAKGKTPAKTPATRTQKVHKPSSGTLLTISKQLVQSKIVDYQHKTAAKKETDLPSHLVDLLQLHKAFLKTIQLRIAHVGPNVPIDINDLAPHIARSWRKRAVTVKDIRRLVALESCSTDESSRSPFVVSDYGRGKICIELRTPDEVINETRLSRQFEASLRALGREKVTDEMAGVEMNECLEKMSLSELPQAELRRMDTGHRANPELTKGHKALAEMKNGILAKKQEDVKPTTTNVPTNPDGSKMSLLDRLRLKQLSASSLQNAPTGPELQRRAALNRVPDIAATISMLSLANPLSLPRQAFTMQVILEKLRDSLRTPVSKEEGADVVRLIASEVAPEWIRIVSIGGRENVVVQRGGQPVDRVLRERVEKLLRK